MFNQSKPKTQAESFLNTIEVASPCDANWNEMTGDDVARFCGACNKNVYNLSSLTPHEAQALIEKKEGKLCVRYYQREDGTMLTQDCPKGIQALRIKMLKKASTIAAAVMAFVFFPLTSGKAFAESHPVNTVQTAPIDKHAPLMGMMKAPEHPPEKPDVKMGEVSTPSTKQPPVVMGKIKPPDNKPCHAKKPCCKKKKCKVHRKEAN